MKVTCEMCSINSNKNFPKLDSLLIYSDNPIQYKKFTIHNGKKNTENIIPFNNESFCTFPIFENFQKEKYTEQIKELNDKINFIKNDNMNLKEDIFNYSNINDYLTNEINAQKEHNQYLTDKYYHLKQDNNTLENGLIKVNDQLKFTQNDYDKSIINNENNQIHLDSKLSKLNES